VSDVDRPGAMFRRIGLLNDLLETADDLLFGPRQPLL
jgi:hypothetical protein